MNFEALNDNVVVRAGAVRLQTDQGVILPKGMEADAHIEYAEVVHVGPGISLEGGGRNENMKDIKPGDVVFYSAGARKIRLDKDRLRKDEDGQRPLKAIKAHEIIGRVEVSDKERQELLDPNTSTFYRRPEPIQLSNGRM